MIEKVKTDPISPKMLKVDGGNVMKIAGIEPGPKVGQILAVLLEEVFNQVIKVIIIIKSLLLQGLDFGKGFMAELSFEKSRFARITSFLFHKTF